MTKTIVAAGLSAFLCVALFSQSSAPAPAFEVASVKPAAPQTGPGFRIKMGGDAGRIDYSNVSLRDVIGTAYNVKDYQISGPDWLNSVRFDIAAKMPADTPKDQVRLMWQNLLAERFKLVLHRESKDLPIFAMLVAKGGPKLKESEIAAAGDGKGGGQGRAGRMMMRPGRLEGVGFTMSALAELLSRQVGRPIQDMTGLTGNYDFILAYTPDADQKMAMMQGMPMHMPVGGPGGGDGAKAEARDNEGGGPSLFTALQEQLGLKLEARKGPLEILVVDSAEKVPSEN